MDQRLSRLGGRAALDRGLGQQLVGRRERRVEVTLQAPGMGLMTSAAPAACGRTSRRGWPAAAESAQLVLAERRDEDAGAILREAWRVLETTAAHRALDDLLSGPEPEVAAAETVLPLVRELPASHRHLALRMTEARLLALGQRWHEGPGRLALVGCGPGEHDTLATIVCALALHRRGWRIVYLGADTPVAAFASAGAALRPAAIVVGAPELPAGLDATLVGDDPLGRRGRALDYVHRSTRPS